MALARMLKRKFAFYMLLIGGPLLLIGIALLIYPSIIISQAVFIDPATKAVHTAASFLARGAGLGVIFLALSILRARHSPDHSRDTILWQSVYLLAAALLLALGPFRFQLSYWVFVPAAWCALSALFLFLYASRNIVVRE